MPRGMVCRQAGPPTVSHGDERAVLRGREDHLDFGGLVRFESAVAPCEGEARRRLPHLHLTHDENAFAVLAFDGFEQPPTHAGLKPYEAAALAGLAKCGPTLPPAVDLVREDLERHVRRNGHGNADTRLVAFRPFSRSGAHDSPRRARFRPRGAAEPALPPAGARRALCASSPCRSPLAGRELSAYALKDASCWCQCSST
jgi:hypothetical protein